MILDLERTIDLKLVVLGEGGVGKTSMVKAFLGNNISFDYLPTIGSSTKRKDYELKKQETTIRVNIWDFGGQRSFNPFNPVLFKNVDVGLLVFDLSKPKETLENIKKEFLENVQKYSEDFISIMVGNKLDLLSDGNKVKNAINRFLNKNDHLLLTSAKTGENINECFELLIHTFLRKAEIMKPDLVISNTANEFLDLIGMDEKELKSKLTNAPNIDSILKNLIIKPEIKEERTVEKEIKELKYIDFLRQELEKNETQKNDMFDQFLINISELDKTIKHLKKSQSKSGKELVDNLKELLITTKIDFEKNVDLIRKLNLEEFELVKIISKTKEEASNPERKEIKIKNKEDKKNIKPQEKLYTLYEKENPGKKALWRGKETKDYETWKEKYGQIMNISK